MYDLVDLGYKALVNAIVKQAAEDYFNVLSNFPINTMDNAEKKLCTRKRLENFFQSQWFSDISELDSEYLVTNIKKQAAKMELIYTVEQEPENDGWYICKVGENKPLSKAYKNKSNACAKAAEMQGIGLRDYMLIRRREGLEKCKKDDDDD